MELNKPKLKLIKTLPHLHTLLIPESITCIWSPVYNYDIYKLIDSARLINVSQIRFTDLLKSFQIGWNRVERVSDVFEFSVKGDIVRFWPVGYKNPVKADFIGEACESLIIFDEDTGRKIEDLSHVVLLQDNTGIKEDLATIKIENPTALNSTLEKVIFSNNSFNDAKKFFENIKVVETDFAFAPLLFSNQKVINKTIEDFKLKGFQIAVKSLYFKHLSTEFPVKKVTFREFAVNTNKLEMLAAGFISNKEKVLVLTDRELAGTISLKKLAAEGTESTRLKEILRQFEGEIKIGDYVVHEDYGVARYEGLDSQEVDGQRNDYLLLKFLNDDSLYTPLNQLNKITKYLGNDGTAPKLSSLSKSKWKETKKKIKASAARIAKELIEHFAKREVGKAVPIPLVDSDSYLKFVQEFKHQETPDQKRSLKEILYDLSLHKPMNRLLVGDVGFGKTEVALRAAFKVIEAPPSAGQVAILAPTTILAKQHFDVLTSRFKSTKSKIAIVSRFNSSIQNKEVIDKVNEGKIDIVVGTHRLLSSDVKFKNLQLLIIDEEQKFGVKQKEKLKKLNYGAHVLSISATPIPRSLSLALSSIQDISIITTPPRGRKTVETQIIYNKWSFAANAIQKEVSRGGQVYFIHNRIVTITSIANKLRELLPQVKIAVVHGRLSAVELDKVMIDFYAGKYDVLLCTTIIENGLDIPNVNTLIIHDSHTFGLSQLYQMRGRVGRSDRKAYCYLMTPRPAENKSELKKTGGLSLSRLQALVDNQELGAGFKIASKDLEIRGAGNILGEEQHGHISTIGYALYMELLAREIEALRYDLNL